MTECSIEGCTTYVHSRGWCKRHYSAWARNGTPDKSTPQDAVLYKTCSVDTCQNKVMAKGLCQKHYTRLRNYGDVTTVSRIVGGNRHKHPLYKLYHAMLDRCYNSNNTAYSYYGERGITVCERWRGLDGFTNFVADMGERPEGLTLDRRDNEKGYSPENCEWSTRSQQQYNRRVPVNNKSGHPGVWFNPKTERWQAYIYVNKKRKHLGYYATLKEAVTARERNTIHGR